MMDISQMYGNHHSSPHNGYQSSDIGNSAYPYFSATNLHHHHHMHQQNAFSVAYAAQVLPNQSIIQQNHSNSQSHAYSQNTPHSHLYSPTALEYGIQVTSPSSNTSPTNQPYFDGDNGYFNQSLVPGSNSNNNNNTNSNNNNASPSETHIISTDNGLSYTNLDYVAYQQAQQHNQQFLNLNDEKSHLQHHFNDDLVTASGSHYQATWQNHGYSLENSENSNQVMTSNNQLTSQMNSRIISPDGQAASPSSPKQQIQQHVPQYKWMQVKRSLPKPQSKLPI
jgi:hypothetical protein